MFKYIKKLTSVVVMFAVIIVFSPSKVYAEHLTEEFKMGYAEASKKPEVVTRAYSVFYAYTFLTVNYGLSLSYNKGKDLTLNNVGGQLLPLSVGMDLDDANSILTAEFKEISRSKEPSTDFIDLQSRLGPINWSLRTPPWPLPFRSIEIKLSQEDMKEYFDSKFNTKTELYELTEKGKKDFEKAKEKGGDGDGGGEGGGGC